MKPTRVAALAALGMMLTSVSVYSLTPPGGISAGSGGPTGTLGATRENVPEAPPDQTELAHFTAGSTLTVDGRLGHPHLARSGNGETFVMLEVRGADSAKARVTAPVNLSLVIDRSGSMKGTRIRNAVNAATTAVGRLNEGDTVSVVTFDTTVQVVVPPTTISSGSRERLTDDIRRIGLGGDTCISCGIEQAMSLIEQTPGKVNKMILLSDGDANHGVRDVPGFRSMAQRAASRGISVTTIGVDVDYNEKIMAAIAQDSNGRHYFVENDAALARVFESEAESLTSTIASGAEVAIDLAAGVELDRVFDRTFRRAGNRIIVPLGTFGQGDVKTVLLKVKVPAQTDGKVAVAAVDLTYRDLAAGSESRCAGKLALEVGDGAGAGELDPVVSGRVRRSETVTTLNEANGLFAQGRVVEAKRKLEQQEKTLRTAADDARKGPSAPRAKEVDADFQNQIAAIGGANSGFASPAPDLAQAPGGLDNSSPFASPPPAAAPQATRAGKSAVKLNQQRAVELGF
ncbi:MAG: vWA domain-containing protein [Byssovorax sp.]